MRNGMREIVPHTRRERVANFGDAQDVVGPGKVTLFDQTGETGDQRLLTVACEVLFIPPDYPGDFRPYVFISWGHGASSVATHVDVTWRQRFPFVGSTLKVQAYIASFPLPGAPTSTPAAVPSGALAKFRAFFSEGIDALPLVPARWVSQLGVSSGVFVPRMCRAKTARVCGILAAASYFQLFDLAAAPGAGAVPFDVVAVDTNGNGRIDLSQTRGFVNGMAWGMSSTPFAFTATGTVVAAFAEIQQ